MPLRELIRPTVRTIRWGALAGSALPATFVVWHFHNQPEPSAPSTAFGLRVAAVTIALGLAFVLDDSTEETTASAPISVLTRRALRIGLTLPPALLFWTLLLAFGGGALPPGSGLPMPSFLVEVIGFAAVAFAGSTAGSRVISDRLGGPAGAGAVVLVALVATGFPWRNGLLTRVPGTEPHDAAIGWWWLIASAATLLWWRMSATPESALLRLPIRRSRWPARTGRPEGRTPP
jgi:fluoroquinolone transport system permease protein